MNRLSFYASLVIGPLGGLLIGLALGHMKRDPAQCKTAPLMALKTCDLLPSGEHKLALCDYWMDLAINACPHTWPGSE